MTSIQGKQSIVIMAGGTGGHVFPGLAVAEQLSQAGVEVHWLGTRRGIEARLVPAAGYTLHFLSVEGLRGRGILSWIKAPVRLLFALQQALRILREMRPGCVLGMGGFAAGPGAVAAKLLRLPLVLHEQNAVVGTTNKILAPLARLRLEGFPNTFKQQSDTIFVGNPLRAELLSAISADARPQHDDTALHVLVLGGSRGAATLNSEIPKLLNAVTNHYEVQLKVRHQTGVAQRDEVEAAYSNIGFDAEAESFIDQVADAYAWADLVICRAGAMTVAELAAAGRPSVLVPFPHAIDDHQTKNAGWLVQEQAGYLVQQTELLSKTTVRRVGELLSNRENLREMGRRAALLAQPNATQRVAQKCLELANG